MGHGAFISWSISHNEKLRGHTEVVSCDLDHLQTQVSVSLLRDTWKQDSIPTIISVENDFFEYNELIQPFALR